MNTLVHVISMQHSLLSIAVVFSSSQDQGYQDQFWASANDIGQTWPPLLGQNAFCPVCRCFEKGRLSRFLNQQISLTDITEGASVFVQFHFESLRSHGSHKELIWYPIALWVIPSHSCLFGTRCWFRIKQPKWAWRPIKRWRTMSSISWVLGIVRAHPCMVIGLLVRSSITFGWSYLPNGLKRDLGSLWESSEDREWSFGGFNLLVAQGIGTLLLGKNRHHWGWSLGILNPPVLTSYSFPTLWTTNCWSSCRNTQKQHTAFTSK